MEKDLQILELSIDTVCDIYDLNKNEIDSIDDIVFNKNMIEKMELTYGIIYNYDSIKFGEIKDLIIDKDNIMEAIYFNDKQEVHIYIEDDEVTGHIINDFCKDRDIYKDETYILYSVEKKNKATKRYNKLKVRKYIDFDEYGQAFYYYMKPCQLKEA